VRGKKGREIPSTIGLSVPRPKRSFTRGKGGRTAKVTDEGKRTTVSRTYLLRGLPIGEKGKQHLGGRRLVRSH